MTCSFHKSASNFDCLRHVTRLMVYHLTVSWEACRKEPTSPKWDLQLVDHSLGSRNRNSVAKTSASALEPNSDGTSFRGTGCWVITLARIQHFSRLTKRLQCSGLIGQRVHSQAYVKNSNKVEVYRFNRHT